MSMCLKAIVQERLDHYQKNSDLAFDEAQKQTRGAGLLTHALRKLQHALHDVEQEQLPKQSGKQ